jgi:hypothetical protein
VCPAKKSGSARRLVCSHKVALAPFSQNSAMCGFFGLVHAQLTHMNPPGRFCRRSRSSAPGVSYSLPKMRAMLASERQPPVGPS